MSFSVWYGLHQSTAIFIFRLKSHDSHRIVSWLYSESLTVLWWLVDGYLLLLLFCLTLYAIKQFGCFFLNQISFITFLDILYHLTYQARQRIELWRLFILSYFGLWFCIDHFLHLLLLHSLFRLELLRGVFL